MADNAIWHRAFGRSRSSTPMMPAAQYNDPGHKSPTGESPPRHRKSASATLKTVSSFLSLKGGISKGGRVSSSDPERIDAPAALAMLPLTETHYDHDSDKSERTRTERGAEGTWHNPNVMQMAELLTTVMMTGAAKDGLPVVYNSCVLAVLEAFYRLTRQLRDTQKALIELKNLREMELEQFRSMTEEWMEKGEAYAAEIKRLELALAKESKDGIACVALMRHGSLVDRAGSRRFQARLKRISSSQDEEGSTDADKKRMVQPGTESLDRAEATSRHRTFGAVPRILDTQNDVLVSRFFEERDRQEQRARQQQGRVRAAPVLVHQRGGRESRNAGDGFPRRGEDSDHRMHRNASSGTQRTGATRGSCAQADDTPRPRAQSQISTDNESSSSDSETTRSQEASSGGLTLRTRVRQVDKKLSQWPAGHAGKEGLRPEGAAGKEYPRSALSGSRQEDEVAHSRDGDLTPKPVHRRPNVTAVNPDDAGQRSTSSWEGGQLSLPEPSHQQQRRRRYSFEKGDDEVLPVSPAWKPDAHTQLGPPTSAHSAGHRETTPSSEVSRGSIRSSASTGTVKWTGDDNADARGGLRQGKQD